MQDASDSGITSSTSLVSQESGRGMMEDGAPLFMLVGWLVVAYCAVYGVTFYIGPMLFGTRPYRPYYGYGRSMRNRRHAEEDLDSPNIMERVSNYIETLY